jgi:UDP-N-acetyl-D-glucosamine dehydrogenase
MQRNGSQINLIPQSPNITEPRVDFEEKIRNRSAKLGVIGLGYVGLPLAVEMAGEGFRVTGIDIDGSRAESVNAGVSYVLDVPSNVLLSAVTSGTLRATQSFAALESVDTISICVPTPLRKTKDPDLSYIVAAVEAVRNHLSPGKLIVIESTTYPGTTRETVLPILEKSGLKAGEDFSLAFSPERVDPGNQTYTTRNIPKIIGGLTARCTAMATFLYQQFVDSVIPVSSSEAAEMVKLLENTFRSVNIALVNEMARMCRQFGINVWEVIDAAKTKPFGFMPFYPGPGLGGHCIPVDPNDLTWKARMNGFEPRLIEMAAIVNSQMPDFTVKRIAYALNKTKKRINGSRILALGIAYKRDVSDTRESPALEVARALIEKGATVAYSDPYVPRVALGGDTLVSVPLTQQLLQSMDCVVILTDHPAFDYSMVAAHSALVVDCRNALKDFSGANVIPL